MNELQLKRKIGYIEEVLRTINELRTTKELADFGIAYSTMRKDLKELGYYKTKNNIVSYFKYGFELQWFLTIRKEEEVKKQLDKCDPFTGKPYLITSYLYKINCDIEKTLRNELDYYNEKIDYFTKNLKELEEELQKLNNNPIYISIRLGDSVNKTCKSYQELLKFVDKMEMGTIFCDLETIKELQEKGEISLRLAKYLYNKYQEDQAIITKRFYKEREKNREVEKLKDRICCSKRELKNWEDQKEQIKFLLKKYCNVEEA